MQKQIIMKDDLELFKELIDYLLILEEDLQQILTGKEYRVRSIMASLRLLVADAAHKNGGLLLYFFKKYNFSYLTETERGKMTLFKYLDEPMLIIDEDKNKNSITRKDIIKKAAQEDGLAHSSPYRTLNNHIFNIVMELGKSDKTNPRIGIFGQIAERILDFGKNFIKEFVAKGEM